MNEKQDARFARWIKVQAYKHDGSLHRQWSPSFVVEETDDYWVLCSRGSSVTENNGRRWVTREHAVFILFKKKWMNVIAMFKEGGGICYYVNIASPAVLDNGYLKYIDYDLDVKLYPDMVVKTLDEKEFERHVDTYGYGEKLTKVILGAKDKVLSMISERVFPFVDEDIAKLFDEFSLMTKPIPNRK
ncbi:MAG: DUF402 domain-containing protein [Bacilli bacterium]|nr:DUF402 domain-containing protein [Bacilli bacterium]